MPPTLPKPQGPIAFVARQAGSAAAFEPLIDTLLAEGTELILGAMGDAVRPWASRTQLCGARFEALEGALSEGVRPSLLITGTSAEAEDDARAWRWAQAAGIPSIAFVDSWLNYGARFRAQSGAWVSPLPDLIAVIDDASKEALKEAGITPERIRVVGSPAFDEVIARRSPLPAERDGLELLFASQPLAGRGLPEPWDEHKALDLLIATLEDLELERPVTLRLRRHPAESPEVFTARLKRPGRSAVTLVEDQRPDRLEAIAAAHVVLGIVSMFLVEAQWLGRPALSIQPGGLAPSDLLTLNRVPTVHTRETLSEALKRAIEGAWTAAPFPPPAIPRWRRLVGQTRGRVSK